MKTLTRIGCHPVMLAVLLAAASGAAGAVDQTTTRSAEDSDDTSKSWQEIAIQLPKQPALKSLLPFDVSATATQTFAIAPESVTVGSDGVVRYVLVAESASGARNISYEGLRCSSLEAKSYAFGHSDGSWTRSRRDDWTPITGGMANRQHAALADGYFCDGRTVAGDPASMLRRLQLHKPLNPRAAP